MLELIENKLPRSRSARTLSIKGSRSASKQERLNDEEIKILQKKQKTPLLFLILSSLLFLFAYQFLPNDKTVLIIFAIFCCVFLGIFLWQVMGYAKDLLNGYKIIYRGKIENRIRHSHKSGRGGAHILVFDAKSVMVEPVQFNNVKTGDIVEIQYSPISSTSFQVQFLNKTNSNSHSVGVFHKKASTLSTNFNDSMSMLDKRILWKEFRKDILIMVLALLFVSYIIIGLVIGGMGALMLFLFPIPILLVFLLLKIYKKTNACYHEAWHGYKVRQETVLIDKYEHHSARSQVEYNLITTNGDYKANKKLYKKIIVNEKISVITSSESDQLLGVMKNNNEYVDNL